MQRLKAKVLNGRITLDAPTDLPDGDVDLVPIDHLVEEERAELDAAIEAALEDVREGRHEDASVVLARLGSRRGDSVHKAG